MYSQHHRFQIWNIGQHPYKHRASEFGYTNAAFGGTVLTVKGALDWILKVLYPNQKESVETVGDLPAAGNTLNDYRVVLDDGDGKQAGYRWEQREGDVAAQWYKIYDFDWSTDSILASFQDLTQDMYVHKRGRDDIDAAGDLLIGDFAGQSIYGGISANSHLTLYANSGDGTGPQTGFVQFGDNVRPLTDSEWTLGTDTYRWANFFTDTLTSGTMTIASGSIVDSDGEIDFGDNNLETTGSVTIGTMEISDGSITDTAGEIDFGGADFTSVGSITADTVAALDSASSFASGTTIGDITIADGSIIDAQGEIDFVDNNLLTTGDITAGAVNTTAALIGDIAIIGTAITVIAEDENLYLAADGTGVIEVQSPLVTSDQTVTGTVSVTGSLSVDNLLVDGNTISSTDTDGNIILTPDGAGIIGASASILPEADDAFNLGSSSVRWRSLYLSDTISNGTLAMAMSVLMSLRDINVDVADGMALFWDAVDSKWKPSIPDDEIDHSTIHNLDADDHLQYALLAGRGAGQTLRGGVDANANLTLRSTSNATRGAILFEDSPLPVLDDTRDIGAALNRWRNLYMTGQGFGFRAENVADLASLPTASAGNSGRLVYVVDGQDLHVDVGGSWKQLSVDSVFLEDDTNWDGIETEQTYDVSAQVTNARRLTWQFCHNSDDHAVMQGARITKPTTTTVKVEFQIAPAAGTYTLVGVGR